MSIPLRPRIDVTDLRVRVRRHPSRGLPIRGIARDRVKQHHEPIYPARPQIRLSVAQGRKVGVASGQARERFDVRVVVVAAEPLGARRPCLARANPEGDPRRILPIRGCKAVISRPRCSAVRPRNVTPIVKASVTGLPAGSCARSSALGHSSSRGPLCAVKTSRRASITFVLPMLFSPTRTVRPGWKSTLAVRLRKPDSSRRVRHARPPRPPCQRLAALGPLAMALLDVRSRSAASRSAQ